MNEKKETRQLNKPPLIILTGPTAVGKTALSVELAGAIDGEIISADSMQIYRGMDIGTAKVTAEEMKGVRHHLIDVLNPEDPFNVMIFQQMARSAMEDIYSRGKIPIIAGGTGFYIQSVLYDINFSDEETGGRRAELEALARNSGPEAVHEILERIDPLAASQIHSNNVKRTIRAIEFFEATGTSIILHNEEQRLRESPYQFLYFVLTMDRGRLYDRIEMRIDSMLENGLVEEVSSLLEKGYTKELQSMQGLGYKEIIDYLKGETTLEEATYILKRDTRHFAKRQLTWFRREKVTEWIDKDQFDSEAQILEWILKRLKETGIYEKQINSDI